jgi:hypothetical protein
LCQARKECVNQPPFTHKTQYPIRGISPL